MAENTVGIIGIGLLGAALTERLLAADCQVIGVDIDPERRDLLARLGGLVAGDASTARMSA